MTVDWRMTCGATCAPDGVRYAVWAPTLDSMRVVIDDANGERTLTLSSDDRGIWSVLDQESAAGSRYAFLPGTEAETPDFYSRSQPDGVHARSQVVDPKAFVWSDVEWLGLSANQAVIYEVHVGTCTPQGTWQALTDELPYLRDLGVTVLEIMPVSECPGNRNWGYDGVYHFAPASYYGTSDDMRRFVDTAHALGLAVILDVVYNHFGPEGNYSGRFSPWYLSRKHKTDWGTALNWDGKNSAMVRQWAIDNACYWVDEFHIDGFRLDATHAMVDASPKHIVQELGERARDVAGERQLLIYAEDGRHDISRARKIERGGDGMDGTWADDFHHEMRVHLTNERQMWLKHYAGSMQSISETIANGFGPTTVARGCVAVDDHDFASAFVFCLQNHDQVGNWPLGERLHHIINHDRYKVASALLLFSPETPLLFMGQEFAASTPFCYFTDMPADLGRKVSAGRRREFAEFGAFADPALRESIPDPQEQSTFDRSKLNPQDREINAHILALYRDLLHLRRTEPAMQSNDRRHSTTSALAAEVISVHRQVKGQELILMANFGPQTTVPLAGENWSVMLNSDDQRYGGYGAKVALDGGMITIPARSAVIVSR